jgi:galactose-1-phosphate uridylyltransferase
VLPEKVYDLFSQQLSEWQLAKTNYDQLSRVRTKSVDFGKFEVLVQFNPERIRSTAAKVDSRSVEARRCFLCRENRPDQQKDLPFDNNYTILINPFPIFHRHLTIARNEHCDQRILDSFPDMLNLAVGLPGYVVFYNGPECGASAPDHLHFQAGERGFMPLENHFPSRKFTERMSVKSGIEIWLWKKYLRGILTLKGKERNGLIDAFESFYGQISEIQPDRPEHMLNIIAYSDQNGYIIHIIPRKAHRPVQFFNDGAGQILVSPASVDLGGVIITPREDDFNRLNREVISDIFRQVCFDENEMSVMMKGYL